MNSKDLLQLYNGQLQEFELAKKNYTDLQQAVYRDIPFDLFRLRIQYNPARMISTNARNRCPDITEPEMFSMPGAYAGSAKRNPLQRSLFYFYKSLSHFRTSFYGTFPPP